MDFPSQRDLILIKTSADLCDRPVKEIQKPFWYLMSVTWVTTSVAYV